MVVGVVLFHCARPIVVEGQRANPGTPLGYVHWHIHIGQTTLILFPGVEVKICVFS